MSAQPFQFSKEIPFREVFRQYVGGEIIPTFDKDVLELVFGVAEDSVVEPDAIKAKLPTQSAKDHFKKALEMQASGFFKRFALFCKSTSDSLLLGFGANNIYYVLAAWDRDGESLWQPKPTATRVEPAA